MARPVAKGISKLSGKHVLVDKANTTVVIVAALTTAVVVFSIFAAIKLVGVISYQNKVISLREDSVKQLESNLDSIDTLRNSYVAFDNTAESAIGTSDKNSKIVLDSLPSKYDFPAFITSINFIAESSGLTVNSITGTDDEAAAIKSTINPAPVEIGFELSATGNYDSVKKFIDDLRRSIRPFVINELSVSGSDNALSVKVIGLSYYQPSKEIGVNEQVVKSDQEFVLEQPVIDENEEIVE